MKSSQINPFSSNYRNTFGNSYVRQFTVYVASERNVGSTENNRSAEKIGQVVDVRVNAVGQFQDLIVDLIAPANRQVRLPFSQTQIDQQMRRVYVIGLSKAEVTNLPPDDSGYVTPTNQQPDEYPVDERLSGERLSDKHIDEYAKHYSEPDQGTTVRLYEERLVVDRSQRRKAGEVIVRKEIETRMIQVPVRHEKLIVEQISPVYEQLAIVNIQPSQVAFQDITAQDVTANQDSVPPSVVGEFTSAESASRFLDAIAHHPHAKAEKIQIKIVLQDATEQATYQQWLERYLE